MKILIIHNAYRYRGGEDEACESERILLASRGHQATEISFDNRDIGALSAIRAGLEASWSRESYRRVRREIARSRPDVLYIHNFFPLASPSVHYAGWHSGVPVVQALHNYRLMCPAATFFRNGAVCEDCLSRRFPWPGIAHRCYRGSLIQTSAVAAMIGVHRAARTWQRVVSAFIAVSEFEKRKFVENGFPAAKIHVKPNYVLDSGPPGPGGGELLYVGRLSAEKGVTTLLQAMELAPPYVRLKIVGEGPLEKEVRAAVAANERMEYLGRLRQDDVLQLMGNARFLILPSECYETFGRVAVEAYSRGTPVIAARIGALSEVVEDGRTGYQFTPGDARDLVRVIDRVASDTECAAEMRSEVRREFERKFTADRNYRILMTILECAIGNNPA